MPDQALIQFRFQRQVKGLSFSDALYFTPEEYQNVTQAQVDTLIAERVANFEKAIETRPPPRDPTLQELEDEEVALKREHDERGVRLVWLREEIERRKRTPR
jgi:hypothetical protein